MCVLSIPFHCLSRGSWRCPSPALRCRLKAEGDLVVCSQAASKITHFPAARLRFGLKPSIIHTFAGRPPVSSGMDAFVPAAQSLFKRAGVLPESSSLLFFSKKGQKATFNFSNFPLEVLRFFLSFFLILSEGNGPSRPPELSPSNGGDENAHSVTAVPLGAASPGPGFIGRSVRRDTEGSRLR